MIGKTAKKKATKKATKTAGEIKVYTITVPYRYDDGIGSYIYTELSEISVYKLACKDLKIICKEEEKIVQYPNSKKFIVEGENAVEDAREEFEFYYNAFSDLGSVYDSSWSLTRIKINGSKITYTVEG